MQNLILISIYEAALTAVLSFSFDTGLIGCFYCPDTLLTTNLAICGHLMATQTSKGVGMLGKRFLRRCRCCCCCWPCSCCFRGCLTCWCSCKAHLGELHGKYACELSVAEGPPESSMGKDLHSCCNASWSTLC